MKYALVLLAGLCFAATTPAQNGDVLKSEANRVAVVEKVKPSVVAIFARGGRGGGTGVLISDDGYALTNFHVVEPAGPTMQCGLPDGILYDAVLVGLDKVGDVALIKLLPKKDGLKFPCAVMGDSDTVHEGDWSIAMGNPFLLATDFTPTVTFGLISGVHRYQYPAGVLLEYTDCIQIDTSINPGNSGGPLFNLKGELIGINGRGSFDKRGRVNSGVGYAISINQIKNFMGQLRAGIDTDHATLGALVTTQAEKDGLGRMIITSILEDSDAARRGLDLEDEISIFAGRQVTSANHFLNILGIYPRGWRVPLEYKRIENNRPVRKEVLVRLMGKQRKAVPEGPQAKEEDQPKGEDDVPLPKPKDKEAPPKDGPKVKPILIPAKPQPSGPAAKFYQAKPGFANYYFNKLEKDRLLTAFKKQADFSGLGGPWILEGSVRLKLLRTQDRTKIEIREEKGESGPHAVVKVTLGDFPYTLEPLKEGQQPVALRLPEGSGGLMSAMYLYHRLLTLGEKGFSEITHGGVEPFYPPSAEDRKAKLADLRVLAEVLNTRHGPFLARWFFNPGDAKLLGVEVRLQDNEDPCEVYFGDYRPVDGRPMPHRLQVLYADGHFGTFSFNNFVMSK